MTTGCNVGFSSPAIRAGALLLEKLSLFIHRFDKKIDQEASALVAEGRKVVEDLTRELREEHALLLAEQGKTATLIAAEKIKEERTS